MSQYAEAEAGKNSNDIAEIKRDITELKNLVAVNNNMVNDRVSKKHERRFSFNDIDKLINEFMELNQSQNECCKTASCFSSWLESKVVFDG